MAVAELLAEIDRRRPGAQVLTDPAQLAPYESDALTAFRARPEAVVLARDRDDVIELVRLCHREGVPFVARGSGTSLSGGSLPIDGGIVIALNQLNRVLRIDPDERIAVVEPGTINAHVSAAAAEHGLFYAPDPSSQQICTIGGNIAFNSGGAHCLKHGMTSNHVLGAEVVLTDGTVVRLGSGGLEAAGPDWLGLFVGSEGLFGIATEITLRLMPLPESISTILAAFPSLEAAGDAVAAILSAGILPVAIEIMDALAIQAAESAVHPGYPHADALLIVELDGERDVVAADFERTQQVIREAGATEIRATEDPDERATIWKGRKSAFSAVGWLSPDYLVQDGCVPRTRLGEALAAIERMSAEAGLRVANVFHAGDGNLHPLILYDGREPGAVERAEELAGRILELCVSLGGSITGEHGVGMEKRAYLPRMFSSADLRVMRRVRDAIDPANLANRGKMLEFGDDEVSAAPGPRAGSPLAGEPPPEVNELAEVIRAARAEGARVMPQGAGTKPALARPTDGVRPLPVGGLAGIVHYDPEELTLTARAGTPIAELAAELAKHGQRLPFDPPFGPRGATLGGSVAAGLSGPGRYRFGGVRDCVIGVRFLDGTGELAAAGGRVVKNAAGFDLPKLFVGSAGRLGVLVDVSLKVLPAPEEYATLRAHAGGLAEALRAVRTLGRSPFDVEAVEVEPSGVVWVRIGGFADRLDPRLDRIAAELGLADAERLRGDDEGTAWAALRELEDAPEGAALAKVAVTPAAIPELDAALEEAGAWRRYGGGAQMAWIAWPAARPPGELEAAARAAGLPGIWLSGEHPSPFFGAQRGGEFARRAVRGLDPDGVFAGIAGID
ncbi:MAG TPA: FAD-binding protein [Solirubrobacterales bacterium]